MDAVLQRKAGAVAHHDVRQLEQSLPLVPGVQLQKCVAAHQQAQRLCRAQLGTQFAQGIHRIAGRGALDFALVQHESRLIGDRQPHHRAAMLRGYLRRIAMRRRAGGNETDLPEIRQLQHLLGKTQMPVMDRVERPAQDANRHADRFFAH